MFKNEILLETEIQKCFQCRKLLYHVFIKQAKPKADNAEFRVQFKAMKYANDKHPRSHKIKNMLINV